MTEVTINSQSDLGDCSSVNFGDIVSADLMDSANNIIEDPINIDVGLTSGNAFICEMEVCESGGINSIQIILDLKKNIQNTIYITSQ